MPLPPKRRVARNGLLAAAAIGLTAAGLSAAHLGARAEVSPLLSEPAGPAGAAPDGVRVAESHRPPPPGADGRPPRRDGGLLGRIFGGGGREGGQRGGPPGMRAHTAATAAAVTLTAASDAPIAPSSVSITVEGGERVIRANGVAAHATGPFPNADNPHAIEEQSFEVRLPAAPEVSAEVTAYTLGTFGVALNGVVMEPNAAEFYQGDMQGGWQYDPLGGAIALGLDAHYAHVQPGGKYHYHGLPTGLLAALGPTAGPEGVLVGWAMDGFPIYYDPSGAARASYRLKAGERPAPVGGAHDGAFMADWEYAPGAGTLDACNGREARTAEFPNGTYAYYLTEGYPVIPRCFRGTPVAGAIEVDASGRRIR